MNMENKKEMESLETRHIKTVEKTIEALKENSDKHTRLINALDQLIGYLMACEKIKKA